MTSSDFVEDLYKLRLRWNTTALVWLVFSNLRFFCNHFDISNDLKFVVHFRNDTLRSSITYIAFDDVTLSINKALKKVQLHQVMY